MVTLGEMLDPRGRQAELAEAFPHLTCWMCGKRMRNNYGKAWIGDDAVMRAVHARCCKHLDYLDSVDYSLDSVDYSG